ncbi:Spi family protease inhibitor [Streptococcus pyogenes]
MEMHFVRTEPEARRIAETFCAENTQTKTPMRVQQLSYPSDTDHSGGELYIYALSPAGFIIVSGDTREKNILGDSFDNNLDLNHYNVRSMVEAYQKQINSLD